MPAIDGYSVYVMPDKGGGWFVRCYRDIDDTHVHSSESAPSLAVAFKETTRAILEDLDTNHA